MKATVLVAAHKAFKYESFGDSYQVIQVGSAGAKTRFPYLHDDVGENISAKNNTYCELTALYWGWKNLDSDIKGLCHYRRYLAHHWFAVNQKKNVLTDEELRQYLQKYDLLVSKPGYRTLELSWYPMGCGLEHDRPYVYTKRAICNICPEYLPAFERVYHGRFICPLNIVIGKSNVFDDYCSWLFSVAQEIERLLDEDGGVPPREIGFITERLLSVYIEKNKDSLKVKGFPVAQIDKTSQKGNLIKACMERVGLYKVMVFIRGWMTFLKYYVQLLLGKPVINSKEYV